MPATLKTLLQLGQQRLAASSDSPRLDAEILLCHVLQVSRAHLYANPEQNISAGSAADYEGLLDERHRGRPVAQLTGTREFWSLPFRVTSDVLSPRPETELLVEQAMRHIPVDRACDVLDLGCGSGAIAVAIATERPRCNLTACDISSSALEIARQNAAAHNCGQIRWFTGNWFSPLGEQRFDVIVSNPPYVATDQTGMTDAELAYEPAHALFSGADGLDDIRLIIAGAPAHLRPGGTLLLEHGFDQAERVADLLAQSNFDQIRTHADMAAHPRVTEACFGKQE